MTSLDSCKICNDDHATTRAFVSRPLLATPLGAGRLLARPGDRRLWLLNAPAAALWDLHAQGLGPATLAQLLTARFGLADATARAQVGALLAQWHAAGLLAEANLPAGDPFRAVAEPLPLPPGPRPLPAGARRLRIADRAVSVGADDPVVVGHLDQWLAPPGTDPAAGRPVDHRLHLHGGPAAWRLACDARTLATGQTRDAALVAILAALTAVGCRPDERLLVLHGAGLVTPSGDGLLLIAPGGSGKTTLAAALDATGFGLLSDDVVPVTLAGALLGLGLPFCVKSGSWPALARCRPDLAATPPVRRHGQTVRLLAPRTRPAPRPVTPVALLLIRYRPGVAARAVPATVEQSLQGLLTAEAVLRDLTQGKLEALARWLSAIPAYTLRYPDLAAGQALVQSVLLRVAAAGRPDHPPCR